MPTYPRNQSITTRSSRQNQSNNNPPQKRKQTPVIDDSSVDEETPIALLNKATTKHPGDPKLLAQQRTTTNLVNPSNSNISPLQHNKTQKICRHLLPNLTQKLLNNLLLQRLLRLFRLSRLPRLSLLFNRHLTKL